VPTTHAGAEPAAAPSGGGSPAGRAGRNLPVAIAIGLVLGAMVLGSIYTYKPAFVGVVAKERNEQVVVNEQNKINW